ncbi:unnamed protein product [Caenorhabditis angaria]|uniref:Nucleotide-diphospho-sugar transferase domain-containing protein n=1 Tax=Caenorhabditis angaria TaxID=860376 RepID=A0A9P1IWV4_9PELO|nr:unnamed protein product [Caenorhabditis angaria]
MTTFISTETIPLLEYRSKWERIWPKDGIETITLSKKKNEAEFKWSDIINYKELKDTVENKLEDGYGKNILFIVMDQYSDDELRKFYPNLNIVIWLSPLLQTSFRPYDTTYMSFFLMRTNMIRALQEFGKSFWMLQADTIWTDDFFKSFDVSKYKENSDILLDQQGFSGTAEVRQRTMNGANFFVPVKKSSKSLVDSWLSWQKSVYITDPDLLKMFCLRQDFNCEYVPYKYITGWEWIYGDQKLAPMLIQMDGETGGNKEQILEKYNFWFLDKNNQCDLGRVEKAIRLVKNGKVTRFISTSKAREQFYLKLGEFMNQIPVFGHYSSIYGGLTSLYLQIF